MPYAPYSKPTRYRAIIRDGTVTISLNGRQVKGEPLTENSDPWIAVRCRGQSLNGLNGLRITGQPNVLDVVPLSNSPDLTGWISYHEQQVIHQSSGWTHVDDPESSGWIIGHAEPKMTGTLTEGLLRYQRPLVEDGSIEYEFFYEPNRYETHPAMDRLAFILDPSGIREHWITDGRNDQTNVDPGNSFDNPSCRRGPAALPLVNREWNRLKLSIAGMTLGLELNGQLVYERVLEPTNQRTFGLFHYLGTAQVRVRNAMMRGEWPKTVPQLADQEVADGLPESLKGDQPQLKASFTHDISKAGFPQKYFVTPNNSDTTNFVLNSEGVKVTQRSTGAYGGTYFNARFTLSGDFDVEASFKGLQLEGTEETGVMMNVKLTDEKEVVYRAIRARSKAGHQYLDASLSFLRPDGNRFYVGDGKSFEATSGRIRLSRRGQQIYYLCAEEDSDQFFLFGTEAATDADTALHGVYLHSYTNGAGLSQVVWTRLVIRSEQMKWYPQIPPPPNPATLSVMRSDGTPLKTIVTATLNGFTSVGSPEWSSDHRKITFDLSNSSVDSSHVFVINADGTDLKDLGLGYRPSFSKDGTRIVCFQSGKGTVTINSDGTDGQTISKTGWGAQWSPNGSWIAFAEDGNITLLDVDSSERRQLLHGDAATRYGSIVNLGWSHDSRSIAFKAQLKESTQQELSLASLDPASEFKVLHPNARTVSPDVTFTPDNLQVLVSIKTPNSLETKLYSLDCKEPGPPKFFDASPPDHRVTGYAWSHDGQAIAITSLYSPPFVEWSTKPVSDLKKQ